MWQRQDNNLSQRKQPAVSEIRLYVTTTEIKAGEILDLMSDYFGEEDVAIATTEVDEKRDIWEASVYLMAEQEDEFRERVSALLAPAFPGLVIEKEIVPDVDWIAKSLEGLKPVRQGASSCMARMIATRCSRTIWLSRSRRGRLSAQAITARRLVALK